MNKRIISLCLALVLLLCLLPAAAPTVAAAGDVAINETNFPDAIFRSFVKQYDNNSDGVLSQDELVDITEINCDHNNIYDEDIIITLKGIEFFSALTKLSCSGNQLTKLDVSKNTALISLNCINNRLTALDVSKNTVLEDLNCSGNQLTALDVSKNTTLKGLYCDCNQLTALDVSMNTSLGYLDCHYNQLTALDVSKNTALSSLECYGNDLTSLDVSKNTALAYLNCSYNQLTALDLPNSTALYSLYCYSNQLTDLKVNQNPALAYFNCSENRLTALDVSLNTELIGLYCNHNQLTTLDVSKNTALIGLDCSGNQLTALDVTRNTELGALYCSGNQLPALDVSKNTKMVTLDCFDNQLTALDLRHNQKMWSLACYGNQLTELDVSAVPYLLDALKNGTKTVRSKAGVVQFESEPNSPDGRPIPNHLEMDLDQKTIPASNPFLDVAADDYFNDAVSWAYQNGVASGTSKSKFSPYKTCTREQVVTFLWRAKGCEEPTSTNNPFKDVPADAYYTKAVLWAVENGITNGKSRTKFGVGDPCTRGQVVTFLWRAEGEPEPTSTKNPFTDVSETAYSYHAILWAVENGITKGTSKTKFSPAKTCTRGEVVTFLYRDIVGEQ